MGTMSPCVALSVANSLKAINSNCLALKMDSTYF